MENTEGKTETKKEQKTPKPKFEYKGEKNMMGRVLQALENHPRCRDNYNTLLFVVWLQDSIKLGMTSNDIPNLIASGGLSPVESVCRARRLIQKKYSHVRGNTHEYRNTVAEPEWRIETAKGKLPDMAEPLEHKETLFDENN